MDIEEARAQLNTEDQSRDQERDNLEKQRQEIANQESMLKERQYQREVDAQELERKRHQLDSEHQNVELEKQKYQNEILAMINSCVSHELRNPLNSIKALNYEKEHLYTLIDEYIENEDFTKEMMISNLRIAMK